MSVYYVAFFDFQRPFEIIFRQPQAVYTAYACDDNYITSFVEASCCIMAQTVYLIVYGCGFFDESISSRDIGFRLVVVIVRDEVFNGVIGEQFSKFTV